MLRIMFTSAVVLAILFGASLSSVWAHEERTAIFESCSPYICSDEPIDLKLLERDIWEKQGKWTERNSMQLALATEEWRKDTLQWSLFWFFSWKKVCLKKTVTYADHFHLDGDVHNTDNENMIKILSVQKLNS